MMPILTLAMTLLSATAAHAASTGLQGYRGKARPLVVVAQSTDQPEFRQQMAEIEAHKAGLAERDMVVLTSVAADDPLRATLGLRSGAFQVVLVGKDGHIAERWSSPVTMTAVFARIDRMPMRRDEMRRAR